MFHYSQYDEAFQDSEIYNRPHTTVKNAINLKSVLHEKVPYFEELPFFQMFISFTYQSLAVLYVRRP